MTRYTSHSTYISLGVTLFLIYFSFLKYENCTEMKIGSDWNLCEYEKVTM